MEIDVNQCFEYQFGEDYFSKNVFLEGGRK